MQSIYCKIRDNFIKTRGYGDYPLESMTPSNIAKVIDNEKKNFSSALARINKSGAAAKKYKHFELAFAIWRSDHATIVEFRRGNTNENENKNMEMIENDEVFESVDTAKYQEGSESSKLANGSKNGKKQIKNKARTK